MEKLVLSVILALIDRSISANEALKGVRDAARQAEANGRKLTLEDLKMYQLATEPARDALIEAIEQVEAEEES